MTASTRRTIRFLLVPVLLGAVLGLLVLWGIRSFLSPRGANSRALQLSRPAALAVSPDGRTLAVAEEGAANGLLIRLLDLGMGAEQSSFRMGDRFRPPRLAFTADGESVAVFDTTRLSWWDADTGRPAEPRAARFAVHPAGLSHIRSHDSVSPDGRWQARGYERHRGLGDLGWDNRGQEFGAFVEVTGSVPAKVWTWRVGESSDAPAVAFSPDGAKLAGTVKRPVGGSILVWAVPK